MNGWESPNWGDMLVPDFSVAESFLRGSIVYLSLLLLFRLVLRRQGGAIGMPDVMLVVLVSEAVSNALLSDAKSVPNGLVVVSAMLFWNYLLDWLAYRWPWFRRRLEAAPLVLIEHGKPQQAHLSQERITMEELIAQLRSQGVDDVKKVKVAYLESGGDVSVVVAE